MGDITLVEGDNVLDVQMVRILANLFGVVTDAATDAPLASVTVELRSPDGTELLFSTMTDSSGNYSIADILPGNYLVYFKKEGYESEVR